MANRPETDLEKGEEGGQIDKLKWQQVIEKLKMQQQATEQILQEQQKAIERRLQEQQQVTEQRLQKQQKAIDQLQKENNNFLNDLNSVVRNQQKNHSQVWKITITMAVAILALVLALGWSKKEQTQQEFVNVQVLNKSIAELVHEQQQELRKLRKILCPGSHANRPASSCQQILDCDPSSSNGSYWIASIDGNHTTHAYCSMNRVCGGVIGGWMRVAKLDMRNSNSKCPSGLKERKDSGHRLCAKSTDDAGCSNVTFNVSNVGYDQMCGKIFAYQYGTPNAFRNGGPVDGVYLDGISLTYGRGPRKHIWSFAAALDEVGSYPDSNCPCINPTSTANATPPPDYVGNDYFCDTGSTHEHQEEHLYADDPLWDGAGCGPDNSCCLLNNPPWFFKQLQSPTSEDIEMRVCCNDGHDNEDIYIEQIELYVRDNFEQ